MLEQILLDHPEVEIVQIQFNYADYLSASVQSKKVYEVCRKFNKPVLVMEPVKGGGLVNLPEDAKKLYDELNQDYSYASYAIRFAASFDGMFKVLSGMSNFAQLKDNVDYMKDFKPLSDKEMETALKAYANYDGLEPMLFNDTMAKMAKERLEVWKADYARMKGNK